MSKKNVKFTADTKGFDINDVEPQRESLMVALQDQYDEVLEENEKKSSSHRNQ